MPNQTKFTFAFPIQNSPKGKQANELNLLKINQASFSFDLPVRTSNKRKQEDLADVFENNTQAPKSKKVNIETGEDEWQRYMISDSEELKRAQKKWDDEQSAREDEIREHNRDRASAQIKQLMEQRRTDEGEHKFQEECKAVRKRLEEEEREKEKVKKAKEDVEAVKKEAKEAEKRKIPPKPYTFGISYHKGPDLKEKQRETMRAIETFVKALEFVHTMQGIPKVQKDGSIQSDLTCTDRLGREYPSELDVEYSQLMWNVIQIFHRADQTTRSNLGWFLDQFSTASRYISVPDFLNAFELLIRTFTIKIDPDGEYLTRFFRVFRKKLLRGDSFKDIVSPDQAARWGLQGVFEEIGVDKKIAKEMVTAMGGDLYAGSNEPDAGMETIEFSETQSMNLQFERLMAFRRTPEGQRQLEEERRKARWEAKEYRKRVDQKAMEKVEK